MVSTSFTDGFLNGGYHRSRIQAANELVLSDKAKDRVHTLEQKMAVK